MNACQVFAKGDPKNYIPEEGIDRIAYDLHALEGGGQVQPHRRQGRDCEERLQHFSLALHPYGRRRGYRPLGEIVEELDVLEAEAAETNTALRAVLKKLGV